MGKRLQSGRAMVVLAVVIVATMAGGSFAAATHGESTNSPAVDGSSSDTPIQAIVSVHPDAAGYSLVAQMERPFVTLYTTHLEVLKRMEKCKESISPLTCLKRTFSLFAGSYDQAYAEFAKVQLPSEVDLWKGELLKSIHQNALAWHTTTFVGKTKKQITALGDALDARSADMASALDDLEYEVTTLVTGASDGKALPITPKQALKQVNDWAGSNSSTGSA